MSLHPEVIRPIPEGLASVAHAIFPKGNVCIRMRDERGTIYQDQEFTELFPKRGQPVSSRSVREPTSEYENR